MNIEEAIQVLEEIMSTGKTSSFCGQNYPLEEEREALKVVICNATEGIRRKVALYLSRRLAQIRISPMRREPPDSLKLEGLDEFDKLVQLMGQIAPEAVEIQELARATHDTRKSIEALQLSVEKLTTMDPTFPKRAEDDKAIDELAYSLAHRLPGGADDNVKPTYLKLLEDVRKASKK